MAPEASTDGQRKQFDRAVKSLRDLGPTIMDAATYAEETYLASDRPDVELANAREYIVSTLASVADGLAVAAGRLAENVRREGEESIAEAELLMSACVQAISLDGEGIHTRQGGPPEGDGSCPPEDILTEDVLHLRLQSSSGDIAEDRMSGANGDVHFNHEMLSASNSQAQQDPRHQSRRARGRNTSAPSLDDCLDRLSGAPPRQRSRAPSLNSDAQVPGEPREATEWRLVARAAAAAGTEGSRPPKDDLPQILITENARVRKGGHVMPPEVPQPAPAVKHSYRDNLDAYGQHARGHAHDFSYNDQSDLDGVTTYKAHQAPSESGEDLFESPADADNWAPENWQGTHWSSTPSSISSSSKQRVRKRDIIKLAMTKFKLHSHEPNNPASEA